jgi:hypothetical protein
MLQDLLLLLSRLPIKILDVLLSYRILMVGHWLLMLSGTLEHDPRGSILDTGVDVGSMHPQNLTDPSDDREVLDVVGQEVNGDRTIVQFFRRLLVVVTLNILVVHRLIDDSYLLAKLAHFLTNARGMSINHDSIKVVERGGTQGCLGQGGVFVLPLHLIVRLLLLRGRWRTRVPWFVL